MSPGVLGQAFFPEALAALGAGILSFLSPCVLPLVPAYLSYLSGYGLAELGSATGAARGRIFARSLAFVLGFTLVFVALGLAFAASPLALGGGGEWLRIASGLLVMLLGLNLVFNLLGFLNLERRFHVNRPGKGGFKGLAGAALLGIAFAAGWSPCIGPILASILLLAAKDGSLLQGGLLLLAYSLGLALPFLAVGLGFDRAKPLLAWAKGRIRIIQIAAGVFLLILGALMALGRLGLVAATAARWAGAIEGARASRPGLVLGLDLGIYALGLAGLVLPWIIRIRQRGGHSPLGLWRLILLALIISAALGELLRLWSLAGLGASWLGYQGA